ncbi:hypothetical protein J2S09_001774 [Bacillus fengqiuensis]|nr:hypothetical protein [Bacillus fengqiuensis]
MQKIVEGVQKIYEKWLTNFLVTPTLRSLSPYFSLNFLVPVVFLLEHALSLFYIF